MPTSTTVAPLRPKRRMNRLGSVLGVAIVVAVLGATAFATGYLDDTADFFTSDSVQIASVSDEATEAISGGGLEVKAPQVATVSGGAIAPPTTAEVIQLQAVEPTFDVEERDRQMNEMIALRDRCHHEMATVFASIQGYMLQTGGVPHGPDNLVDMGWLEPHPEGWSSRWQWDRNEAGLAVVPVPGTLCDG